MSPSMHSTFLQSVTHTSWTLAKLTLKNISPGAGRTNEGIFSPSKLAQNSQKLCHTVAIFNNQDGRIYTGQSTLKIEPSRQL